MPRPWLSLGTIEWQTELLDGPARSLMSSPEYWVNPPWRPGGARDGRPKRGRGVGG
eukprot:CAMPEP_0118955700 /NCGR_PEP_ID=MMETSP1169-20130426/60373_1 /TAXON_ID=36882 /ORGANISM="Pyramimonas obovata, Strain CCMP722" /LENGTH=55 /DNA_ID=CAMNT_0006903593 /DNA_START=200 /DNA_END=363 /DNA_ORIENTATION=-